MKGVHGIIATLILCRFFRDLVHWNELVQEYYRLRGF